MNPADFGWLHLTLATAAYWAVALVMWVRRERVADHDDRVSVDVAYDDRVSGARVVAVRGSAHVNGFRLALIAFGPPAVVAAVWWAVF